MTQDVAFLLKLQFQGIRCFGQPGVAKSDNVYAVISLFGPEQALIKSIKAPIDDTDESWHLETGDTQQFGAFTWNPVPGPTPPQPVRFEVDVWRCSPILGECRSTRTKTAVIGAAAVAGAIAGGEAGSALGRPDAATLFGLVGGAFGVALGKAITDDTRIGGQPIQFNAVEELDALPPENSLQSPPNNDGVNAIPHNVSTPFITDGPPTIGEWPA
jgi:hypothetical protein